MAKRQKEWARKARQALLVELGGRCAICGTDQKLTFDCIIPQGDDHHKKDTSARMSFYWRQHREGNAQILCEGCNGRKGDQIPF